MTEPIHTWGTTVVFPGSVPAEKAHFSRTHSPHSSRACLEQEIRQLVFHVGLLSRLPPTARDSPRCKGPQGGPKSRPGSGALYHGAHLSVLAGGFPATGRQGRSLPRWASRCRAGTGVRTRQALHPSTRPPLASRLSPRIRGHASQTGTGREQMAAPRSQGSLGEPSGADWLDHLEAAPPRAREPPGQTLRLREGLSKGSLQMQQFHPFYSSHRPHPRGLLLYVVGINLFLPQ